MKARATSSSVDLGQDDDVAPVEIAHHDLPEEHAASHRVGWPMFADRLRTAAGS